MYEHLVQNIGYLFTFMALQSFFGNYIYSTFISVFLSQEILTKKIKLRINGRTKINNKTKLQLCLFLFHLQLHQELQFGFL